MPGSSFCRELLTATFAGRLGRIAAQAGSLRTKRGALRGRYRSLRAPIFYAWHVAGWTCAGHGCDFRRVKDAPYGSLSGGNARRERSIIATEAKAKDDLDGLLVEIRRAPPHLFNSLCASRLVRSTNSLSSRIVQPTGCGAVYESAIYVFRKTHDVL